MRTGAEIFKFRGSGRVRVPRFLIFAGPSASGFRDFQFSRVRVEYGPVRITLDGGTSFCIAFFSYHVL